MIPALKVRTADGTGTPIECPTDGHTYARVPHQVTITLPSPEHHVATVLLGLCRDGQMFTDKTNKQIGEACNKSESTIERILPRLEAKGVIRRIGRAYWRRIEVLIVLRGQMDPIEGSKGKNLPSLLKVATFTIEGSDLQIQRDAPSTLKVHSKEEKKEKNLKNDEPSDERLDGRSADPSNTGNTPPEVPPAPPRPLDRHDVLSAGMLAKAWSTVASGEGMVDWCVGLIERHEAAIAAIADGTLSPEVDKKTRPPSPSPKIPGGRSRTDTTDKSIS